MTLWQYWEYILQEYSGILYILTYGIHTYSVKDARYKREVSWHLASRENNILTIINYKSYTLLHLSSVLNLQG